MTLMIVSAIVTVLLVITFRTHINNTTFLRNMLIIIIPLVIVIHTSPNNHNGRSKIKSPSNPKQTLEP